MKRRLDVLVSRDAEVFRSGARLRRESAPRARSAPADLRVAANGRWHAGVGGGLFAEPGLS